MNWTRLGLKSYQVFNNLNFDVEGKDKSRIDDVLFMFLKSISNPHSLYSNCGTNLVPCVQANVKTKLEFLFKLNDVANNCSLVNKDEIVKCLFLIHNRNERVIDQLIEKMKTMDTHWSFKWLKLFNEQCTWRHYLNSYSRMLENLNTTTEVLAVQKHPHSKNKHFQSNSRGTRGRKSSIWDKSGKKCGNCGWSHLPKQCPAYGKECFKCKKKKNHFSKLCQSSEKKPGSGLGNPKYFSKKDVYEVEKSKFEYDTDIMEFKWIQLSTPVFNSRKDSPNSQNIMFDEMSQRNYTEP